jgi:hypothetical protein
MLNFLQRYAFMPQSNTIARLLASLVVILGALSLATGLLRLFFSGAQPHTKR